MKLIGTGSFTKCYLLPCNKKVLLKSCDPIKECMANGWFPSSINFPLVNYADNGKDFTMSYYAKVSSLKNNLRPSEWVKYQQLRDMFQAYSYSDMLPFYYWTEQFKTLKNRNLAKNLQLALEACSNFGQDVSFEISPRNVAVSKTGTLILLDCFYMRYKLHEVNNSKRRNNW